MEGKSLSIDKYSGSESVSIALLWLLLPPEVCVNRQSLFFQGHPNIWRTTMWHDGKGKRVCFSALVV